MFAPGRGSVQCGSVQRGFSLLEVLVALAVLAIAIMSLTALRTESVITAAQARNLRVAGTIAKRILSELQAGMQNGYEVRGTEQSVEGMNDFTYKVLIGDTEIQEEETSLSELAADEGDAGERQYERQEWLNERREAHRAQKQGVPVGDLEREELEVDDTPDEETIEELAIYVYYPKLRNATEEGERAIFKLRSRISTLALSGLTSEQAEDKLSNLSDSKDPTKSKE